MIEPLFLDTDCLSTFLVVRKENLMLQLYNGRIGIPKQVYKELEKVSFLKSRVDSLINSKRVLVYHLDINTESGALYLKMTKNPDVGFKLIGSGEAAAIVLTKQYNGILGSNNMRDIIPYIQLFGLKHRTSADIMVEAFEQNLISEGQGNTIWREMLDRNRKLPTNTFTEFLNKYKHDK